MSTPAVRAFATLMRFVGLLLAATALTVVFRLLEVGAAAWIVGDALSEGATLSPGDTKGLAAMLGELALTWTVALLLVTLVSVGVSVLRARRSRAKTDPRRTGALLRPATVPAQARCPHCHDELVGLELDGLLRCPGCDAPHHAECWRMHGGCSVHACQRSPAATRSRARP